MHQDELIFDLLYSDEGWFAHVDEDSVLFIKQFANVPYGSEAPTEGEIELWLTGDHSYIELENQGKYEEIPAEYQSEYLVKWYLFWDSPLY